jgi:subtilase family serine protease
MHAPVRFAAGRKRTVIAGMAAVFLACGTMATAAAASSHPLRPHVQPALLGPASNIAYAVSKPLCATAIKPGQMNCFAMARVTVKKGTPGAYPYLKNTGLVAGPAGGYTPADLALLYGYNPKVNRTNQTVGIVDWYDDPHIASDLNTFDKHYGLHTETATSFRKVDQHGAKSPLPSSARGKGTADEISLDVDAVRGVCHTCKILLVEANGPTTVDLATAENTAARLGATEITNSFGGPEGKEPKGVLAAFNHPGVAITVSTGDDGWFGWDFANNAKPPNVSENAAEFPSTDPDVVAVGGTGFTDKNGVSSQYVWNNNGADDKTGLKRGEAQGAGGGGCSQVFAATTWQSAFPGYTATGCGGARLAADVSALADPATGYDEYNTWGGNGWVTVGGTSLASPIVAAMFALAGGSGGAAYPSMSIYENASLHPTSLTDITKGGNGFCAGSTTTACGNVIFTGTNESTHNPNALGAGNLDCSFPRNNTDAVSPPLDSECNAVTGFDGPSGVGTPKGVGLFTSTSPRLSLTVPTKLALNTSENYIAHATELLPSTTITSYTFNWGDGQSTTGTSASATHTYVKAGSHTLTVTVTDSAGQKSVKHTVITIDAKLIIKVFGSASVKVNHKATFTTEIKDPNTGGKVTKVSWNWGDHKTSRGTHASHAWHKAGKYTLTVTVTDNTGATTVFKARITVKA